ncbi:hypothetical protein HK098_005225 [Nowakowskiella sp. JEL0407]|nr:hypothetical protein HK098_005225 [Nowakowskiella sp. JEL0407]
MGYLQYLGLLVAVVGQALRTIAQFTAESNFTHQIAEYKQKDHVLVTSGIYKYLRHPSYTGFFYWGIGLQILLSNPISFLGFVIVLWKFFDQRILIEEQRLVEFFGGEYKEYRKRAKVYIPFIP